MLKVTYLENELYLEYLHTTVEDWIALRVILALRTGQRLMVEQMTASVLLPISLLERSALVNLARREDQVDLVQVDDDDMEVSLVGSWVSSGQQEAEGVFVATLSPSVEHLLAQLWQMAQSGAVIER
ncbi:MAG: hypothetical protein KME07_05115 [Pegethrix bostrychoides GSE-TBD4-15B]|jgi:hypothetical protein|uniref:Uncharacterized protein n=1 Tax=Pegethrix bostrychoides GSE-TBD4-15B TaxID=2839662 RepID=A0A951U3W7_9CYAN|nr:hypothetical protein [Pegethrix bostrychoides GSE-TBD4-15B]